MRLTLLLAALVACGTPPVTCATDPQGLSTLTLASPSDGVSLRGPWVPLLVPVAPADERDQVLVCVDGSPHDDPLALIRRRSGHAGGGWDYLGLLELLPLDPGEHSLRVYFTRPGGRRFVAESRFTWDRPAHAVRVRLVDEAGAPASARVVVMSGGDYVDLGSPDELEAEPYGRDHGIHSFFVVDGEGSVWLDGGDYRLLVVSEVRDELVDVPLTLDDDVTLDLVLPRGVHAPEYLSADLHVHTGASYDSFIPDVIRYRSLMAAGLDVAVITDHNRVRDPAPALGRVAAPSAALRGVAGIEADIRDLGPREGSDWDLGHMNAFPVLGPEAAALPDRQSATVGAALDAYRERQRAAPYPGVGEDLLLQLNHPRGIHFRPERAPNRGAWPLFSQLGFDPALPLDGASNAGWTAEEPRTGTTALDFDAVEVMNRFSWPLYLEVRRDWFALLDQGQVITATGNSDSHAMQVEVAGFPVNLVAAPRPGPGQPLDVAAFVGAIQAGRVLVTTGPVVELTVLGDDGAQGGLGERVRARGGAVARVRVRAASWVPVDEVRVVVNGDVVLREPITGSGALDLTFDVPLALDADAWVIAEAGWPIDADPDVQPVVGGDYGLVAPGYVPVGFTNPVFVDVDADGAWTPPGL